MMRTSHAPLSLLAGGLGLYRALAPQPRRPDPLALASPEARSSPAKNNVPGPRVLVMSHAAANASA